MLTLTICRFCGDSLHSFVEEIEDGTKLHLVICPTCYQTIIYSAVSSKQVAVSQRVEGLMSTS